MSDEHSHSGSENIFFLENQEITVNDFETVGLILDIGGGGEGIIGQLKAQQVIAIDPNRKELEEAPEGPLKIVMDASELLFLDHSFQVVTSFFTLMYIKTSQHEQVFKEVFRVLRPGGCFNIWDMEIPKCKDDNTEIVAAYLEIKLPDRVVNTGFGTKWPEQILGEFYYQEIAESVGFEISKQKVNGQVFQLELRKPY